jgi:hypothetical protein
MPPARAPVQEMVSGVKLETRADGSLFTELDPRKVSRESVVKRFKTQRAAAGIQIDSPLAELREALEDEKEAMKFLGDPMFWRDFTSIEQNRIFRISSVEYKNLWLMFWETIFYLVFIFIFTAFVFTLQSESVYECRLQQRDYWLGCTPHGCAVDRVNDLGSFWRWMSEDFIEKSFPTGVPPPARPLADITTSFKNNQYSIANSPRMVGETNTNVLLGAIRVRQLRVKKQQGCKVSALFQHVFPDCYPAFSPEVKSSESFGTRYTPTYLLPAYDWLPAEETTGHADYTLGSPLAGALARYPGDGFMFDVPADRAEAKVLLKDLWDWNWVDRSTRSVIVEMNVLNTNTNVMLNTRVVFEFGPTGTVRPSLKMNAFRVMFTTWALNEGEELAVFLCQTIVLVLFACQLVYHSWLIWRVGVKYFQFAWNLLDLVNILLAFFYLFLRVEVIDRIASEPTMAPLVIGHPNIFIAFSRNVESLVLANQILSVLSCLVYVKLLKYLPIVSWFRTLEEVLVTCIPRLLRFALLIILLFFGFGVAFFVGLGQTSIKFSNVDTSFLSLFFMFIEGINIDPNWFEPSAAASSYTGPLMSLSYLILVYFILSNMFMAIVVEAYVGANLCKEARVTEDDLAKRNPMVLFLYTYYHKLRNLSLLNDDEALPEEQSIALRDLPGIVVRKWLEKKRRMQLLVDRTLGDVSEEEAKRMLGRMHDPVGASDRKRKKKPFGLRMTEFRQSCQRCLSLPMAEEFVIPEPEEQESRVRLYLQMDTEEEIALPQLQALIDQEPTLQILLGTKNAIDVIRHFKAGIQTGLDPDAEVKDTDPLEKVAEMQEGVFKKIEHLEKKGLNLNRSTVPFVDEIADEITHAITSVQNEWREELTRLIEQMTYLADGFKEMKTGMDTIVHNHNELASMLRDDDDSEVEDETTSSSESGESATENGQQRRSSFGQTSGNR